ncbi:hemin uptake protein HemP [Photobacterium sp. TY 1-4]|uniref:Hemin uptake protein HemP n=1 Tax=Pseudosulfitobacter koreensis TaxID=2968472 RepID=A0ABT1YY68_9RHOB|nr:hemin uptake protein HemP [Pseudosulfitobacter koreense]
METNINSTYRAADTPSGKPEAHDKTPGVTDTVPAHDARRLTEGADQARIVLDGQVYTLRITRAGKLILTK